MLLFFGMYSRFLATGERNNTYPLVSKYDPADPARRTVPDQAQRSTQPLRALIHGDLDTTNCLFEGERLVAFVDWQEMGVSAALMDFVQTVIGFCFIEPADGSDRWAVFDPDLYRALYANYTSLRPFTRYELEHLDNALKYVALTQPVRAMLTWEQYHSGEEMIETRLLYWMFGVDKLSLSAL